MQYIIWMIIMAVISYTISRLMMKAPQNLTPSKINFPNIEEGRLFPVVFGTPKRIIDPTVAWWGDVKTVPIREKVLSRLGWEYGIVPHYLTKDTYQTVGYKYYVGIHYLLCHGPIDGIKQIHLGDKLIWPNPDDPDELADDGETAITIDQEKILGGASSEGGISGDIDIEYGAGNQPQNSYLAAKVDANISANRGLVGVVLEQAYIGTSPYVKSWGFTAKRTAILDDGSPQWYLEKADINGDLNPAHIIRECMTNEQWGVGESTELFDDDIWKAVADQLYDEGFGLSALWEGDTSLEEIVNDILRHILAVLYQEPTTGKFILKLIRKEEIGELETFDDTDIAEVKDFARPSLGEIPDVININYWDVKNNKTATVPIHDIAIMDAQGGKSISLTESFQYITKAGLAGNVAARERSVIMSMAPMMKIIGNRRLAHLRPGDVFILKWPKFGIVQLVVRIISANYGTLQNGQVTLDCVGDVWATESAIYAPPPGTGWTDPVSVPQASPHRSLSEVPFYTLVKNMGLANAMALTAGSGYLMVGAMRPTDDALDYELLIRDTVSSDFTSEGIGAWTPTGTLAAELPKNAVNATIELSGAKDLDLVEINGYAVIDSELVKITAVDVDDSEVTITRGVLDTVPVLHSAGARMWFVDAAKILATREYAATAQPATKVLSRTGKGELSATSAPIDVASAFNSRQVRPYPPGNFKINTVSYPSSFSGQPTISWSHRDRTLQTSSITEHSAASIGPETGTTYTLKIYDEDNVLVRTEPGLTGTSYLYTEANERADCGLGPTDPLNTQLRFELWSIRDGYDSWQKYDLTVARV